MPLAASQHKETLPNRFQAKHDGCLKRIESHHVYKLGMGLVIPNPRPFPAFHLSFM